ncbi:GspH/FimT family pseudopilin [Neptuniibacter sp.]|uniref:GspH/FimT family pseudopilin n=1 Tax=Neptuniibacter sp. TaxID=1962643 RepID=UPI003B5B1207
MLQGTRESGLTLIELLITVIILGIVAAYGVPNMTGFFEKQRVSGAAHTFLSDVQFARAESIKQNQEVYIYVDEGAWCYGLDDDTSTACSCSATPANCTINGNVHVVSGTDFPNVAASESISTAGNVITFDPVRGTLNPAATVNFSSGLYGVDVRWGLIGRARLCATSGPSWGYDSC